MINQILAINNLLIRNYTLTPLLGLEAYYFFLECIDMTIKWSGLHLYLLIPMLKPIIV